MSQIFNDGVDLNTVFPGKQNGTTAQSYVYQLFNKILTQFEYLIDMHTGKLN
jgi:predicted deacylase